MTDERRWIASVRELEPPDYWDDALRSTGAVTDAEVDFLGARPPIPEEGLDLLIQVDEDLEARGIARREDPDDDIEAITQIRIEIDALRVPTNDPVRMYLKGIGKVPLLNAPQEVDLARRIEAGELCTELQHEIAIDGKLDPKRFRLATTRVWEIWNHQVTAFGRVEGIGRDPIAQKKSYRPGSDDELVRYLHRVERDGQLAKRKLIEANLRLVVSIAEGYVGRGMLFLDLIQEGNLGLIRAIDHFDPSQRVPFVEVAGRWIRQAITRAIDDQARTIRIPAHMVEPINKLVRVQRLLLQDLRREATPEEIGAVMGIGVDQVREIQKFSQEPVTLETEIVEDEDQDGCLWDFIEDADAVVPVDEVSFLLLQEQLGSVLHTLSEREKKVIELRFGLTDGDPHTLEEVAREFGLTREQIRRIESKTLSKLRRPSRLRDFLE